MKSPPHFGSAQGRLTGKKREIWGIFISDRQGSPPTCPNVMAVGNISPDARARHPFETLKLLEAAYHEHSPGLIFLQNEPLFDFLHSNARYQSLAQKLPPAR